MLCNRALLLGGGAACKWLDHVDQTSKYHTACIGLLSNQFGSRYGPRIDIKTCLDIAKDDLAMIDMKDQYKIGLKKWSRCFLTQGNCVT